MADPQAQQKKMGQIIAKTWSDPAFKQKLMANPAATLMAEGIDVPAGMDVRAVENTDKVFHMVLLAKPKPGELEDEALDKVSGGLVCAPVYVPENCSACIWWSSSGPGDD